MIYLMTVPTRLTPKDYNKTVYVGFGDKKKSDSGAHGVVTHKTENKEFPPPEPMNLNNTESNAEKAETGIPVPNENAAAKATGRGVQDLNRQWEQRANRPRQTKMRRMIAGINRKLQTGRRPVKNAQHVSAAFRRLRRVIQRNDN